MKKNIIILLLFVSNLLFAQTVSDPSSYNNKNKKTKLVAEQSRLDSLNKVNAATITHIKKIFKKYKNHRPKIGLALAGGGAKGFAHAGVLQILDSLNIPVDYIVGNSMGGLVAALYSIGYSGKDLEDYAKNLNWDFLLNDAPPRSELPFIEKRKSGKYQLSIGLKGWSPTAPSGFIYGQNVQLEFLKLTSPYEHIRNFDKLPIPFRCVAVDLVTGKEVILKKGSLAKAMRATMSIPSAFSPVDWGKYLLVDGLVLNNFPVDIVKNMGADIIIGLNLTTGRMEKKDLTDFLSILNRTTDIPTSAKLQKNIDLSDIYISQDLQGFSTADFDADKIAQIVDRGKKAAKNNLDVFVALKKELSKYDDYRQWEKSGKEKFKKKIEEEKKNFIENPPIIENIVITGNKKFDSSFIKKYLSIPVGVGLDIDLLQKRIAALYALNYFETVTYEIQNAGNNNINLMINVKEKLVNKIVAGFKYNDYFKLVGLLGVETNSALIPGAQLEAYIRFGGLTQFDITVLYPSRSMDIPAYPFISFHYKDVPIDFYYMEKKYFRFRNRSIRFYGGGNFSLSKFWNLELGLDYEKMIVGTDIATPEIDSIVIRHKPEASILQGRIRLFFDSLDDVILPSRGLYLRATYEFSSKNFASDLTFHRFYSFLRYFQPIKSKHNIMIAGGYFYSPDWLPFYKWFYVGGPDTFWGIDYFQASGTEFGILQAGYRFKLLNNIYIKGIYNIMFNYNLSTATSPYRGKPILGGGISLMMRNMFGKFELAWTRGEKNVYHPGAKSNKIYFSFGYNLR